MFISARTRTNAIAIAAIAIFPTVNAQQNDDESGPTKNETNISAFQGNYFGKSVVEANGNTLRGRGIIRARINEDGLTGRFRIQGNVKVRGERVPIDNRFTFRPSGRVNVQELAPAVSNGEREKGFYTADPREVRFIGQFNLDTDQGRVSGSYECVVRVSVKRIIRMRYTVTLEDETSPAFVYRIVAEPRETSEDE